MSGIDEQEKMFECPNCGDVTYWVLGGQYEGDNDALFAFLNNPNRSNDPTLEIIKSHKDMSLHTMLVHTRIIRCGDCDYELLLDSLMWEKVSNKVKAMWEKRVCV